MEIQLIPDGKLNLQKKPQRTSGSFLDIYKWVTYLAGVVGGGKYHWVVGAGGNYKSAFKPNTTSVLISNTPFYFCWTHLLYH